MRLAGCYQRTTLKCQPTWCDWQYLGLSLCCLLVFKLESQRALYSIHHLRAAPTFREIACPWCSIRIDERTASSSPNQITYKIHLPGPTLGSPRKIFFKRNIVVSRKKNIRSHVLGYGLRLRYTS